MSRSSPSRALALVLGAATVLAACTPAPAGAVDPDASASLAVVPAASVSSPDPARPSATDARPTRAGETPAPPDARQSGDGPIGGPAGAGPSASATAGGPAPAAVGSTPTPARAPAATAAPTPPPAEPFAINLYRRGDYVAQYTFEWCVGSSIQMTLLMLDRSTHTSGTAQQGLWEMARDRSSSPFGGANPRGWVAALNDLGVGPYRLVSLPDLDTAIRTAAEALATTGRPVGLVMWRGRHAWVMSGFESVGDPRRRDDFRVTGIRVLDPLYPHGSRTWGPSPEPNSLLTPEQLGKQFVARTRGRVNLGVPPGWLLVLPTTEA